MQHVRKRDIGNVVPLADDEAAILAHAPLGGQEAEGGWRAHGSLPELASTGILAPCSRRAASSIASTIWP